MTLAVVGLGASLGDRERGMRTAVQALDAADGVDVVAVSRLYRTVPLGPAQGWFLNAAVAVQTTRSARGLLALCKDIEVRLGRRPAARWHDRALDLDLLAYGRRVRPGPGLALPHPGLLARPFALTPAAEVAPDWTHPLDGRPLSRIPVGAPTPTPVGVLSAPRKPLAGAAAAKYTGGPGRSARMKIFLDTANLDEIREAVGWGIVAGVTTNPSLLAREGSDFVQTLHQICELVRGPVSAETVAPDVDGMVREGRLLAQIHEHVVVKVPMTPAGLAATRILSDEGLDVNVTLIFQPAQALLAARAGAAYVSPFVGRLDDVSQDGLDLVRQIVQILERCPQLGTQVIAASIRHARHVTGAALAGAHVATVPLAVLRAATRHPLTDRGLEGFLTDWAALPDNDIAGSVQRWLAARGR